MGRYVTYHDYAQAVFSLHFFDAVSLSSSFHGIHCTRTGSRCMLKYLRLFPAVTIQGVRRGSVGFLGGTVRKGPRGGGRGHRYRQDEVSSGDCPPGNNKRLTSASGNTTVTNTTTSLRPSVGVTGTSKVCAADGINTCIVRRRMRMGGN